MATEAQPEAPKVVSEAEELPKAIVRRVVKDKLSQCSDDGSDIALHKDALLAFSEGGRIFIHYLSATANDICRESKRQTISADDVLKALEEMEFPEFIEPLKASLDDFRRRNAEKKATSPNAKENNKRKKEEGKNKRKKEEGTSQAKDNGKKKKEEEASQAKDNGKKKKEEEAPQAQDNGKKEKEEEAPQEKDSGERKKEEETSKTKDSGERNKEEETSQAKYSGDEKKDESNDLSQVDGTGGGD